MSKRMLIDAAHPEETRVAVVGAKKKLEELDYETQTKQTIKGNIYLAKIMRIEPSLQAAFIDYGGDRHGFLPFSEIHPDYFRIPIDDRKALDAAATETKSAPTEQDPAPATDQSTSIPQPQTPNDDQTATPIPTEQAPLLVHEEIPEELAKQENSTQATNTSRRQFAYQRYKMQEVIQRNQILLVQAVKETRGTKGAAFTSYISLAGRYCVLMPNSPQSGGVSRKIASVTDRTRLREILKTLELPQTMGIIIRTAGRERKENEIKRDSNYLLRLWNRIRKQTLQSVAPALVYEEANLIKRSIRDFYTADVSEIWVEGVEGHKIAKDFMHELLPSHCKRIREYVDPDTPLFQSFGVQEQIDQLHSPQVSLPSGGSLVINQTEALVAIDINSGKATKGRHIEETAYKTNLEAATEVARQLRLRDMAGLIVIDFIDMENTRHSRAVEQRLISEMQNDRARTTVGPISQFGLLEMSRQRLRPSIIESNTSPCTHCNGSGVIRSIESSALEVFRAIDITISNQGKKSLVIKAPSAVIEYILNQKRYRLIELEMRHKIAITLLGDNSFTPPQFDLAIANTEEITHKIPSKNDMEHKVAVTHKSTPHPMKGRNQQRRKQQHAKSQSQSQPHPQSQSQPPINQSNGADSSSKSWWRRLLD